MLVLLIAVTAYFAHAHDIYELLEDQKGLVSELTSLTDIVHSFQDTQLASEEDFKHVEKELRSLSIELDKLVSSLSTIETNLGLTATKKAVGLDKNTSDRIIGNVDELSNQLAALQAKAKQLEESSLETKIDAATKNLHVENKGTVTNAEKLREQIKIVEGVETTEGGFLWIYILLGITTVILLATWWSFRKSENKVSDGNLD